METKVVDIAEARDRLSELIDLAQAGTEVIIATDERPMARLIPVNGSTPKKRVAGLNRGQIWMSDDFDAPLPDEFWLGEERSFSSIRISSSGGRTSPSGFRAGFAPC